MDQRERADDGEEALRAALDGRQATMWTALPGVIESFDPAAMTAVVQPAIQGRVSKPDGSVQLVNLPLLLDCPVVFPSGGGATLTFPVKKGDECLVVFTSRCMDGWWQNSGVQAPLEARMHDLSDGMVLVGPRSKPKALGSPSTTKAQLRSDTGETFVELDPAGQTVNITAPGGSTIHANVTINGTLHVTGKITADADLSVGGNLLVTGNTDMGGTGGSPVKTVAGTATKAKAN